MKTGRGLKKKQVGRKSVRARSATATKRAASVKARSVLAKKVRATASRGRKVDNIAVLASKKRKAKTLAEPKVKLQHRSLSKRASEAEFRKKPFRSRAALNGCSRRKLIAFAEGRMELDEKLDILYHLDRCQKCWHDLYLIRKSKNGRLYSRKTRSYSEADIKALEKESSTTADEDALAEAESAFDVA